MSSAGLDNPDDYRLDIRNPGRGLTDKEATHVKAFRLAIRNRRGGISLPDLLAAGPLPPSEGSVTAFRDIHDRGLAEVATFLSRPA